MYSLSLTDLQGPHMTTCSPSKHTKTTKNTKRNPWVFAYMMFNFPYLWVNPCKSPSGECMLYFIQVPKQPIQSLDPDRQNSAPKSGSGSDRGSTTGMSGTASPLAVGGSGQRSEGTRPGGSRGGQALPGGAGRHGRTVFWANIGSSEDSSSLGSRKGKTLGKPSTQIGSCASQIGSEPLTFPLPRGRDGAETAETGQVWAYQPTRANQTPPRSGWKAGLRGHVNHEP